MTPRKRMTYFLFTFLFATNLLAQIDIATEREMRERAKAPDSGPKDFLEGTEVRLSSRYFRGGVLVYDCRDRHFVCTSISSANECHDERMWFINKDRFELPCAPIKQFKDHESCVSEQYKRVHDIPEARWCYNDKKLRF